MGFKIVNEAPGVLSNRRVVGRDRIKDDLYEAFEKLERGQFLVCDVPDDVLASWNNCEAHKNRLYMLDEYKAGRVWTDLRGRKRGLTIRGSVVRETEVGPITGAVLWLDNLRKRRTKQKESVG